MNPVLRSLLCFLLLVMAMVGCKKEKNEEPVCSEAGPACLASRACADSVQTVAIPDMPIPKAGEWYNPKVGFVGGLPGDGTNAGVMATYVINSRQEAKALVNDQGSYLLMVDYCQFTALVFDLNAWCSKLTEQSLTRQCDQYTLNGLITNGPWGCTTGPWHPYRYFLVVPKVSKCAQVQFKLTVQ